MTDDNASVIEEFRANHGKVGGRLNKATLLLLHHTSAKNGNKRVTPLAYKKMGDSYAVFASWAGAPRHHGWFHNLVAHPDVTIEVGSETIKTRARVAEPTERDKIYSRIFQQVPLFGEYARKAAPRFIPVVLLEPCG